mmetsp:Transcript_55655/g.63547  ORF Transcript_55655/g.63547 Transcript_55655/m.63547 type:complete len:191 (+) Transcript_55655:47-619(+)
MRSLIFLLLFFAVSYQAVPLSETQSAGWFINLGTKKMEAGGVDDGVAKPLVNISLPDSVVKLHQPLIVTRMGPGEYCIYDRGGFWTLAPEFTLSRYCLSLQRWNIQINTSPEYISIKPSASTGYGDYYAAARLSTPVIVPRVYSGALTQWAWRPAPPGVHVPKQQQMYERFTKSASYLRKHSPDSQKKEN